MGAFRFCAFLLVVLLLGCLASCRVKMTLPEQTDAFLTGGPQYSPTLPGGGLEDAGSEPGSEGEYVNTGDTHLSASYSRTLQVLTVELNWPDPSGVDVELSPSEGVTFPDGLAHTVPDGVGELELTVEFADDGPDRGLVEIYARDSGGAANSISESVIKAMYIEYAICNLENETIDVIVDTLGDSVTTVTLSEPPGVELTGVNPQSQAGGGDYAFGYMLDFAALIDAEVLVVATDQEGRRDTEYVRPVAPGFPMAPGVLYAYPLRTRVGLADTVRIVVASGSFPADAPFNYCDGVGFTVKAGADYAANSFNVGAPGGAADEADGIWGTMSPAPIGFIMPQDWMMSWTAIPGDSDNLGHIDFTVAAIGGSGMTTLTDSAIFNFGLEFTAAGTYNLGFQYFEVVRRTYYSGPDTTTYEWDDLSNDHLGSPNSIVVE